MLSGSADPQVVRITRADGRTAWIETQNFYLYDNQEVVATVSETRDITARIEDQEALRLSEQYRRALLEAMPDTLFRLNVEGVLLDFVSREGIRASHGAAGQHHRPQHRRAAAGGLSSSRCAV